MIDITMYSDDELSLIVNNDEGFYLLAQKSVKLLLEMIEELYIYTNTQLKVLKDDIDDIIDF
ncbi:unnamed protein product [marine sediment metagenome]|uniref:Uncharacterized protein n=1 Tax=marine sediment metagenome TaxID=412755 RepID=X0YYC8_9ZZZZ